jgi:hypothetical protein
MKKGADRASREMLIWLDKAGETEQKNAEDRKTVEDLQKKEGAQGNAKNTPDSSPDCSPTDSNTTTNSSSTNPNKEQHHVVLESLILSLLRRCCNEAEPLHERRAFLNAICCFDLLHLGKCGANPNEAGDGAGPNGGSESVEPLSRAVSESKSAAARERGVTQETLEEISLCEGPAGQDGGNNLNSGEGKNLFGSGGRGLQRGLVNGLRAEQLAEWFGSDESGNANANSGNSGKNPSPTTLSSNHPHNTSSTNFNSTTKGRRRRGTSHVGDDGRERGNSKERSPTDSFGPGGPAGERNNDRFADSYVTPVTTTNKSLQDLSQGPTDRKGGNSTAKKRGRRDRNNNDRNNDRNERNNDRNGGSGEKSGEKAERTERNSGKFDNGRDNGRDNGNNNTSSKGVIYSSSKNDRENSTLRGSKNTNLRESSEVLIPTGGDGCFVDGDATAVAREKAENIIGMHNATRSMILETLMQLDTVVGLVGEGDIHQENPHEINFNVPEFNLQ